MVEGIKCYKNSPFVIVEFGISTAERQRYNVFVSAMVEAKQLSLHTMRKLPKVGPRAEGTDTPIRHGNLDRSA